MNSFWSVFLFQVLIIGIIVYLGIRRTNLTELLSGGVLIVVAFGIIIFSIRDLSPEERSHWLLKPIQLVGIGDGPSTRTAASAAPSGVPAKAASHRDAYGSSQRHFETKRAEFAQQYAAAPNEIRKSAVWNAANEWTINFAKQDGLSATKWIARVSKITTDQGGGRANVELVSDYAGMNITYRASGSASLRSGTLIYDKVADLSLGDIVEFDALFSASDKKGFDEASWTERGSLEQPVFTISLIDVRKWVGKPDI